MIRLARIDDHPAIDAFDPFAGDRTPAIAAGRCFVACPNNIAAAFLIWQPAGPEGFVGRPFVQFLAVHPNHRQQGLARSLLDHILTQLPPGERLFISTEAHNSRMQAVLQQLDFTFAGEVAAANDDASPERFYYRPTGQPTPHSPRDPTLTP